MSNIGTKFIIANRFVFDPNSNSLTDQQSDNEVVRLGSNESRILLMLSEKPNEVITRNELHEFVWRKQGFQVDDSSLTQAISTLRKMLKDSTKSPQFVKTVPKRGYMLISTVERAAPLSGQDEAVNEFQAHDADGTPVSEASVANNVNVEASTAPQTVATKPAPESKKTMFALVLIAVLLPLFVMLMPEPVSTSFKQIAEYDGTPIRTPESQPDLSSWLPQIERCVERYNEVNTGDLKPVEVIATGGQNNQLVLNYVHSAEYSVENTTIRFFFEQTDLSQICN
ncbi:winged helix-turn-helix domain-containing protein [Vibrio maerlii]|uniref:winged helix-turn-helix domain-containing protein n=1 Tax=Vibrio maerlii TaxID=2231648 RepID=UPI000E3EB7A0|nr:transcriptional regulator [Vibrio maerlii]